MNPTTSQPRAAIYARIGQDDSGAGRGVERQLEDTRALAAARGWEVVGEFSDNDVSAYTGAVRPGYAALMAAVQAREVDRIVVYMTSRLWRSRKERATAMEQLAEQRVSVAAVSGPELDLASASGRMVAGILGEFDTAESAIKSERVAPGPRSSAPARVDRPVTSATGGRSNAAPMIWPRLSFSSASVQDLFAVDNVLPARARANGASWVMNRKTINTTRQMAASNYGSSFWANLAQDTPIQLLDHAQYEASSVLSTTTTGTVLAVLGDFSRYLLIDRIGTQIEFVQNVVDTNGVPTGTRGWVGYKRVGAAVDNVDSFRFC